MLDVFADAVKRVDFSGGLVRMELVAAYPPGNPGDAQINLQPNGRLVMPLDGFLSTFQAMQHLIDQLVTAGIVQNRHAEPAVASTSPP
ncbi:MAG: hypothetical protein HQL87_11250 [Magnetococcales bacterium]|nr:hypothetical protein [Magnetococcales bacterium]